MIVNPGYNYNKEISSGWKMDDKNEIAGWFIREVQQARKYRGIQIAESTLRDLVEQELARHRDSKTALKSAREKLHHVMAPYLGDPDYEQAARELDEAFASGQPAQVRSRCQSILAAHASTRERLPFLERFYAESFALTGLPHVLLDLACGLNPLAFPWMGLPPSVCYRPYDIHSPRVALINHFFSLQGLQPLAEVRDILVEPPHVEADVALFFKEAHRFEQRRKGCLLPFWKALNVRWLLVSLPVTSLSGRHNLVERQRGLVYGALQGMEWEVREIMIENELVFCIHKDVNHRS
jgi:16S rRNA (guanine(1405)-N(7))-methyltransferase